MSMTPYDPEQRKHLLFLTISLSVLGFMVWLLKISDLMNAIAGVFTILAGLLAFLQLFLPQQHSSSSLLEHPTIQQHPPEKSSTKIEGITPDALGITRNRGALLVYSSRPFVDTSVHLAYGFDCHDDKADFTEHISKHRANNRTIYVAIFPDLPAGKYTVWSANLGLQDNITIRAREVKELPSRRKTTMQRAMTTAPSLHQAPTLDEA